MDTLTRNAIDDAERTGYLSALRAQAQSMCVPFWWHGYDKAGKYKILRSGTICFVDTHARKFAITADHVLTQYLVDKEFDPTLVCQLGSATVDLAVRVIARDERIDLATIDVSEVLVSSTGGFFHAPPKWPPHPLLENEIVLCGGYPGNLRVEHANTADLPFQWFIGRATSVSPQNISLHLNFKYMHTPLGDAIQLNRVIGGMSGGPILRFVEGPIEHLEQAGVIYQYHETYELMLARPIHLVNADGTITPEENAA